MNGKLLAIQREVLRRPGVEEAQGRFGAAAFSYREHETPSARTAGGSGKPQGSREEAAARG